MARFQFAPAAALGLFVLLAAPASAQQPANVAPPEEEIIVTGQRSEEAIRNFVGQVTALPRRGANQLATWDGTICPGVAGLRPRYAQFVIDRMAQRAIDVGLDIGQPGCRANILILVSADPGAVARDLVEHHPAAMGIYSDGILREHHSRSALAAFESSTAPVRWWHVTHTVDANGNTLVTGGQNATTAASRLHRNTAQEFGVAFVIVDARRLNAIGVDFGALADYLAMVALARLDPAADTSAYTTILNLFSNQAGPRALTDWDMAFLRGLYTATPNAVNSQSQAGEIARSMNRELSVPPAENPSQPAH